jgi:predicted transcriptional regulator
MPPGRGEAGWPSEGTCSPCGGWEGIESPGSDSIFEGSAPADLSEWPRNSRATRQSLTKVIISMQNAYMTRKDAAVTLRLPDSLKRRFSERARRQRRSLSAQLLHDLETVLAEEREETAAGRFLGLYAGSRVPTEADIKRVRGLLWGKLGVQRHE